MNRNKNLPLVVFLSAFVLLFLIVNAIRHIRVYVVYSSGLGPFMIAVVVIIAIIFIYIKGQR